MKNLTLAALTVALLTLVAYSVAAPSQNAPVQSQSVAVNDTVNPAPIDFTDLDEPTESVTEVPIVITVTARESAKSKLTWTCGEPREMANGSMVRDCEWL